MAEILIIVGIIGVIAETTIPSLINDYQDKVITVSLKKEVSLMQQALNLAFQQDGGMETWYTGSDYAAASDAAGTILAKYLKVTLTSFPGPSNGTLPFFWYTDFSHNQNYATSNDHTVIQLVDGSIWYIFAVTDTDNTIRSIYFNVDVNGMKPPNRGAYDYFWFIVYSTPYAAAHPTWGRPQVMMPYGSTTGNVSDNCNYTSWNPDRAGMYCTAWAYYQGNLDYKYVSNLNWNGPFHK